MITRVRKYIRDHQMLKAEDMVVAGVSGGADSIAMLHILKNLQKEIGFSMEVVHVHHGIRGQEADRDEQFVEKICRDWGIPVQALSGSGAFRKVEAGRRRNRKDRAKTGVSGGKKETWFFRGTVRKERTVPDRTGTQPQRSGRDYAASSGKGNRYPGTFRDTGGKR